MFVTCVLKAYKSFKKIFFIFEVTCVSVSCSPTTAVIVAKFIQELEFTDIRCRSVIKSLEKLNGSFIIDCINQWLIKISLNLLQNYLFKTKQTGKKLFERC